MTTTAGEALEPRYEPAPHKLRIVAAGMIGNVLEFYDFAVYGFLAVAIAHNFFPRDNPTAGLLAVFGVFAIGYVMRPIGGVVIGHIGDRYGRRAALVVSVSLMATSTFLMGVLPNFAALGLAAPMLLVGLRMFQGVSVGGELPSSMVFLIETAGPRHRGLYGAFSPVGGASGVLLGSAMAAFVASLVSSEQLSDWGWRIPFLFGPVIGIAGYVLRRRVVETLPAGKRHDRPPIVEAFRKHSLLMLRIVALFAVNAVAFFIMFVYVASWLQSADGIAPETALQINTVNLLLLLPVMLAAGVLSDRVGRKPVLLTALVVLIISAWPLFWLLHHPDPTIAYLGQLGFVPTIGVIVGVQNAMMIEAVPRSVRCTTVALAFNISIGVAGGTAPLIAAWLVLRTGYVTAPVFYIIAAAVISLLSALTFKETYRAQLPD